jgi:beta-glucosidase
MDESQLPQREISGLDHSGNANRRAIDERGIELNYFEGAQIGYKWLDKNGTMPLFPFGFGLSYTAFAYTGLTATASRSGIRVDARCKERGAAPRRGHPAILYTLSF